MVPVYGGLEAAGEVGVEKQAVKRFLQRIGALEYIPAG